MTEALLNNIFDLAPSTSSEKIRKTSEKASERKKIERDINNLALNFVKNPTNRNFDLLMKRVNWGLRAFIFKMLKDNSAVDDVMSRTMESVYFKRDTFDVEKGNFSTWIYKIALNYCLKYLNDEFSYNVPGCIPCDIEEMYNVGDDDAITKNTSSPLDHTNEIYDILFDEGRYITYTKEDVLSNIYDASVHCIDNLPDNLRIVMRERFINKKKVEDISTENKIPLSSVKNWIRRGVVALNEELKYYVPDVYEMYCQLKASK